MEKKGYKQTKEHKEKNKLWHLDRKNPKSSETKRKQILEGTFVSSMEGQKHSGKSKNKMRDTRKRLFKEGKIPKINKGSFKKGHLPHNRNKKMPKETITKMVKTRIKNYWNNLELQKKAKENAKEISKKRNKFYEKNPEAFINRNKKISESVKKLWENPEYKEKNALFFGETNPNWNGGTSHEPYGIEFNNKFKRAIRKRDNQVCMDCGIHRERLGRALDVHHINYDKLISIPQNCISLCMSCHRKTNFDREIWTKHFQSLLTKRYDYQYSENQEIILKIKNV